MILTPSMPAPVTYVQSKSATFSDLQRQIEMKRNAAVSRISKSASVGLDTMLVLEKGAVLLRNS